MSAGTTHTQLPRKQLAALALCRFAQPFALASNYPFLPEYIEWQGIEPVQVAAWLGIFVAAFSCFEAGCAIPWAHFSDRYGRRVTILVSQALLMAAYVGLGLSKSIWLALIFVSMAGAGNGNIGVLRTIVAELVPQKELQTIAFTVLPTTAALGGILGPLFGGNLADPVTKYPRFFAGSAFLVQYPFALPNLCIGICFLPGILTAILVLEETGNRPSHLFGGKPSTREMESAVARGEDGEEGIALMTPSEDADPPRGPENIDLNTEGPKTQQRTRPSLHLGNLYLWINSLLGFHSSGFDNLIPVFLHFPYQPNHESFLRSASGFGKGSAYIGAVLTGCGLSAISATLLLYPRLARHFDQASCLKVSSAGFPFIYSVIALSVGIAPIWLGEAFLLLCICLSTVLTVTLKQCCLVLLSNSVDAPDLARLNGLNVTVASIARGLGAAVIGMTFSLGAGWGYVVVPFWILALVASVGVILALRSKNST